MQTPKSIAQIKFLSHPREKASNSITTFNSKYTARKIEYCKRKLLLLNVSYKLICQKYQKQKNVKE